MEPRSTRISKRTVWCARYFTNGTISARIVRREELFLIMQGSKKALIGAAVMASHDVFDVIAVADKGGHAGSPRRRINRIIIPTQIIVGLQTTDLLEPSVIHAYQIKRNPVQQNYS